MLRKLVRQLKEEVGEAPAWSPELAKWVGDQLGIDWSRVDLGEFAAGLGVESEHDVDPETDVVDDLLDIGKIAWAHLKERPDYYSMLKNAEADEGAMGRSVWNADQPRSQ